MLLFGFVRKVWKQFESDDIAHPVAVRFDLLASCPRCSCEEMPTATPPAQPYKTLLLTISGALVSLPLPSSISSTSLCSLTSVLRDDQFRTRIRHTIVQGQGRFPDRCIHRREVRPWLFKVHDRVSHISLQHGLVLTEVIGFPPFHSVIDPSKFSILLLNTDLTETTTGNGNTITSVSEATSADVDRAVAAAQKAFDTTWGLNAPGSYRASLIHKLGLLMEAHKEELAAIEALDVGTVGTLQFLQMGLVF